jgi:hypothetical protein
VFDLATRQNNNVEIFVSAIREDRQAFSPGHGYWYGRESEPGRFTPSPTGPPIAPGKP